MHNANADEVSGENKLSNTGCITYCLLSFSPRQCPRDVTNFDLLKKL
jgi:hypothetical protein